MSCSSVLGYSLADAAGAETQVTNKGNLIACRSARLSAVGGYLRCEHEVNPVEVLKIVGRRGKARGSCPSLKLFLDQALFPTA